MRHLAIAALALLAGCTGVGPDTHFTVPEDAKSFQDAHTGDGYDLRVRVVDQNGTPVQGAAVVWFHGDGAHSAAGSGTFSSEGGRGEFSFTASSAKMVAGARTGQDGLATADLDPGSTVHVAAGGLAGLTTEVRLRVGLGSGGDSGTITVPLYPERVVFLLDVRMGNHLGATPYVNGAGMESHKLTLSADGALDEAYRARLASISLAGTWENKPGEGADLYLGLGTDPDAPTWSGEDHQQYVADGVHTETLDVDDVRDAGDAVAAKPLRVFLMTDWVSGGINGVPVHVDGEAVLKGSNVRID